MNKLPSNRNKSKDNPYTLGFNEEKNVYTVEFEDNKKLIHRVEITEKVYSAFDKFELEDISQIHKERKHIERNEVHEETLYHRAIDTSASIEEQVENKILNAEIRKAINELSDVQKRRVIKYYFEEKNVYEIAKEEGATHQSVSKSLNAAKDKLKEILKKFYF